MENSISIESKDARNYIDIDVHDLRDVEQGILNYMLLSNSNFIEIKDKLLEDDFTFLIHKVIFKYLVILDKIFLSDSYHGVTDLNTKIEIFADVLSENENVKVISILDILSQTPSTYIERDLEIINANSMEKEIVLNNNGIKRNVTIEDKNGKVWLDYIDDRLIGIGTTNIAKLPEEMYTDFSTLIGSFSNLDLQNGENEASMTFYGNPNNPDGIESVYLKKDISELKWFNNICEWADKYNLDEDIFPRDKDQLQNLFELDISDKGLNELPKEIGKLTNLRILMIDNNNIKEFPNELYQLKNLSVLSFINNDISYISEEIVNFNNLLMFFACRNNIAELPMSFYKLNKLEILCLHGNKMISIANEIGNLSSLSSLTISNNDIKVLPQSIEKLQKLESLEMENTHIRSIPMELLKLRNINALSINDDLLPFVAKNIQYINVDTINLSASNFSESSEIVQELNFKVNKDTWVEDRDKKDNGCINLFKNKEDV